MKVRRRKSTLIVRMWHKMPPLPSKGKVSEGPFMTNLRGNRLAKILIIAPPATPKEYETGYPLSDAHALIFHELLQEYAGLDTSECLVMPCARWSNKKGVPNKASTEAIRLFFLKAAALKQFKLFICVGDDAFKFMFGRGKKPPMLALQGNVMYVPETQHKPLYVFPSLTGLHVKYDDSIKRGEMSRAYDWQDKITRQFAKLAENLKKKIKELKIKI